MASDIGKKTPLMVIVSYILDECDKNGLYDKDKVWLLALRALTDLHFDIAAEPETFRLPINGNKTVSFPNGCIDWTKIGILNDNGEICTIAINNALTKWKDQNANRIAELTPDINNSIGALTNAPVYLNYYMDGNYFNLYGLGGGLIQYGSCTVDNENELVVLDPNFQYDHIMFECITGPQREDDYMVLTVLQEAIIAFVKAKLKLGSMNDYYAETIKARRRLPGKKVKLQQINQILRESTGMKLRS